MLWTNKQTDRQTEGTEGNTHTDYNYIKVAQFIFGHVHTQLHKQQLKIVCQTNLNEKPALGTNWTIIQC